MKTMKTKEIVNAYAVLKDAKLSKMTNDADKFSIVKTCRQMKKAAEDFESFKADAIEKLKGDNHDELVQKVMQLQQEEREGKESTLTLEEKKELNDYFMKFDRDITQCLKEEAERQHELDLKTISEESFQQLVSSNDWTMEQIMCVEDAVC